MIIELPATPRAAAGSSSPRATDTLAAVAPLYDIHHATRLDFDSFMEVFTSDPHDTEYLSTQANRLRATPEKSDALVAIIQAKIDELSAEFQRGSNSELIRHAEVIDELLELLDLQLVQSGVETSDGKQKILGRLHDMFGVTRQSVAQSLGGLVEVRPRKVLAGTVATCAIVGTNLTGVAAPAAFASVNTLQMGMETHSTSGGQYDKLLSVLAKGEGTYENYDGIFGNGGSHSPDLISMTIGQVRQYQQGMLARGAASTAAGRYQIMDTTLRGFVKSGRVSNSTQFSAATQDKLAIALMEQRGLDSYLAGTMSSKQFGHNLSMVWASLPRLDGNHPGQSYYQHDGLNHAFISVPEIMSAVKSIKAVQQQPAPSPATPKPASKPPAVDMIDALLNAPVTVDNLGSTLNVDDLLNAPVTVESGPVQETQPTIAPSMVESTPVAETKPTPEEPATTTPPPVIPSPEITTPSPANSGNIIELTKPATGVFEGLQKVPAGGIGHDMYYSNQVTDLNSLSAVNSNFDPQKACGLASVLMIRAALEKNPNIDVKKMYQDGLDLGIYVNNEGSSSRGWLKYLKSEYGLSSHSILDRYSGESMSNSTMDDIDSALARGDVMLVHTSNFVAYRHKRPFTDGHLMVLYGKADGKYYVANPGERSDSNYGFTRADIMNWIDGVDVVSAPADTSSSPATESPTATQAAPTSSSPAQTEMPSSVSPSASEIDAILTQPVGVSDSSIAITPTEALPPTQQSLLDTIPAQPAEPMPAQPTSPSSPESTPTGSTSPSSATSPANNTAPSSGTTAVAPATSSDSSPTDTSSQPSASSPATSLNELLSQPVGVDVNTPLPTQNQAADAPQAPSIETTGPPPSNSSPEPDPTSTPVPTQPTATSAPTPENTNTNEPSPTPTKEKPQPAPSAMTKAEAKKICSDAGTTYSGSAIGYIMNEPSKIHICDLPSSIGAFPVNVEIAPMVTGAINELAGMGIKVKVISGYRSKDDQAGLRSQYHCKNVYGPGDEGCTHPVAIPGTSNHQDGLAVDLWTESRNYTGKIREVMAKHGLFNNVPNDENHFCVPNGL